MAAYRLALQELTRERVPLDWAMTQVNLGDALLSLGERRSGDGASGGGGGGLPAGAAGVGRASACRSSGRSRR